jgi:hypothetical protein
MSAESKGRPAMIHSSADKETGARPIRVVDTFRRFRTWTAAVLGTTRASLQKVEDAHVFLCRLASFSAEDFKDAGIDPSDATGIPSWQSDLPFFMQIGFGRT